VRSLSVAVRLLLVCLFVVFNASAQTTSTASASPQAATAIQNAIVSLSGPAAINSINDVTLTGTAEWIAGSDDETGTVTYRALVGTNRLALNLSNGPRTETRSATGPAGSWSGSDTVSHPIALHNLLNDPGWFPLFVLGNLNASVSSVLTYVGPEMHNGVATIHVSAVQQPPASFEGDAVVQLHLTQIDLFFDSSSFLPIAYAFNIHPDKMLCWISRSRFATRITKKSAAC
jgi:hypothetical protein